MALVTVEHTLFDLLGHEAPPGWSGRLVASEVHDPRPDQGDDSHWWATLLKLALVEHGDGQDGVLGVLHGIRCCGARLVQPNGRLRLVGGNQYEGGWDADCQEWLMPHRDTIAALLRRAPEASRPPAGEWSRR